MGVTSAERRFVDQTSVDGAFAHIKWLEQEAPGRVAGTEAEKEAVDYVCRKLKEYGVSYEVHEIASYVSVPLESKLEIVQPSIGEIVSLPLAHSASTGPDGLRGELLFVGSGAEEYYRGVDARGKIVLFEHSYTPPRPEKVKIAQEHGALAAVSITWGRPDFEVISRGTVKPVWGNPTPETMKLMPQLPVVSIRKRDGQRLVEMITKGRVEAIVRAKADTGWKKTYNVVAKIGNGGDDSEFVLLGGHLDAWNPGVTCNATGVAMMLELARVFQRNSSDLKRELRIAFWTGHETGIMSGSTWYVDNFWTELRERCLCYVNCDSPGLAEATIFGSSDTEELSDFTVKTAKDAVGEDFPIESYREEKTGDRSFFGIGIPCTNGWMRFSPEKIAEWHGAILGWWNHTRFDTIDKVDPKNYERDMHIKTLELVRLLNARVYPFNFRRVVKLFQTRIEEFKGAQDVLDLTDLSRDAAELDSLLNRFYEHTADPRTLEDTKAVASANEVLRVLGRELIPVNYSGVDSYYQDTYGSSYMRYALPRIREVERLSEVKDTGEKMLLITKLVRERNRISDTLRRCSRVVCAYLDNGNGWF